MVETELDVLRDLTGRLERLGIDFMLTGSLAMNYYAQPRMTRDIDVVIAIDEGRVDQFIKSFDADYYLDRKTIKEAISRRGMFNLIHNATIVKIDCVVLKTDAYRQEEFERRQRVHLDSFETWIVSREDLILSKLFWAKDSRSEMQLHDVKNLLSDDLDQAYLHDRAAYLGVSELLEEVLRKNE